MISYTCVFSLKKEKEEKKYHSWGGKCHRRRRSNKLSFLGVLRTNEIVSGHSGKRERESGKTVRRCKNAIKSRFLKNGQRQCSMPILQNWRHFSNFGGFNHFWRHFGATLAKCKEVEICAVKAIGALVVQREALVNVKAYAEHSTKYKLHLQTSYRMMRA